MFSDDLVLSLIRCFLGSGSSLSHRRFQRKDLYRLRGNLEASIENSLVELCKTSVLISKVNWKKRPYLIRTHIKINPNLSGSLSSRDANRSRPPRYPSETV